jgi:hypothetical protein
MKIIVILISLTIAVISCIGIRAFIAYTLFKWSFDAAKRCGASDDEAAEFASRST